MKHIYFIDNEKFEVDLDNESNYVKGVNEVLINRFEDLTSDKDWFNKGFSVEKSPTFFDEKKLYLSTQRALKKIISELYPNLNLKDFTLEKYHNYIEETQHEAIIKKTRRLFPKDLNVDITQIVNNFSKYFNTKLSFTNPITGDTQWMIARINRPKSNNFNTAHKDVYQVFDQFGEIPKMVNIWIPLCGVNVSNSLPLVPGSHKIAESMIIRSKAGATINNTSYSVASIKSWNNSTNLERVPINSNEVLIFSSHLIHGLSYNPNDDITRVSFEFRLYEEL